MISATDSSITLREYQRPIEHFTCNFDNKNRNFWNEENSSQDVGFWLRFSGCQKVVVCRRYCVGKSVCEKL